MKKKTTVHSSSKVMELEKRLSEAEEILDVLRNHKADAIIGAESIAMLRLQEVEDQLQEQIQISGNRLKEIESIYQNVPVGLCILDRDLKFIRINKHLSRMHGIPAEEYLGRRIGEMLPKLKGDIEGDLQRVIETGEAQMNVEVRGETPAQPGTERHFLVNRLPVYNKQERVIGINMVVEEITERKEYEERLQKLNTTLEERVAERTKVAEERAEKLREMTLEMIHVEEKERQRLARILHDGLQQLLTGAKFKIGLLRKRLQDQHKEIREADQLDRILDQSIKASRSLSYELSPPILHDQGLLPALKWLAGMPHMQDLNITIHAADDILALPQHLKVFFFQAIRELLLNVIKHAEVDEAEIRISSDEGTVIIEVIDQGKGFDASEVNSGSFTSQGLRNIHKKLELMNGWMHIDSKPGAGSHFTLSIPVDENIVEPGESARAEPGVNRERTVQSPNGIVARQPGTIGVLVVDDHQVMRNGLVRLLAEEPDINVVGEASNGLEAIRSVHKLQPDVVIMDITMPEMDGIEATRLIHREFPEIRIIGLSMHEESAYSLQMKKVGATDLLNKGGPSEQLFDAIRNAVRK